MDELIFDEVVDRFNQLCQSNTGFPNVLGVRRDTENKVLFQTTSGEAKGSLRLDGADLVILIGGQIITISLVRFMGRSN